MPLALLNRYQYYGQESLNETQFSNDPIKQFQDWLVEAEANSIYETNALLLGTVNENNRPSTRTLLLKGVDETGLVFLPTSVLAKVKPFKTIQLLVLCLVGIRCIDRFRLRDPLRGSQRKNPRTISIQGPTNLRWQLGSLNNLPRLRIERSLIRSLRRRSIVSKTKRCQSLTTGVVEPDFGPRVEPQNLDQITIPNPNLSINLVSLG